MKLRIVRFINDWRLFREALKFARLPIKAGWGLFACRCLAVFLIISFFLTRGETNVLANISGAILIVYLGYALRVFEKAKRWEKTYTPTGLHTFLS